VQVNDGPGFIGGRKEAAAVTSHYVTLHIRSLGLNRFAVSQ
jgi:hypothetical protein